MIVELVLGLSLLVIFWLWWAGQGRDKKSREMINKIPGPATVPVFGNAHSFFGKSAAEYLSIIHCYSQEYGHMYRTWWIHVPVLHVSRADFVEVFLTSTENIRKSQDYDFMKPWLGTGLLTSSGSKWQSRRKMLTPAFHFQILEQFIAVFHAKAEILVSKLSVHTQVDVVPLITLCALDIICETAMGTTMNAQDNANSPYVATIHETNALLLRRMLCPWLYPDFMFHLSPSGRRFKQCVNSLHSFTFKVIRERRAEMEKTKLQQEKSEENPEFESKRRPAFLDLLLSVVNENGEALTDEEIREEVDTFMFEGHDTTAMGMSWALLFIASNPQVQAECVSELDEIFTDSSRAPTLSDLNNMKYLERVIKETLRLRPSVFTVARNLDRDVTIGDYEVPAGTDINIDILNLHRNPEFHPDPEKFDPDRFLPENCQSRHTFAYIPFSAGPRNCIGQKFALLEEKCVISSILRHFKLQCDDPEYYLQMVPDLILRPKNGVVIHIATRS